MGNSAEDSRRTRELLLFIQFKNWTPMEGAIACAGAICSIKRETPFSVAPAMEEGIAQALAAQEL
jgi:hypothetical protein